MQPQLLSNEKKENKIETKNCKCEIWEKTKNEKKDNKKNKQFKYKKKDEIINKKKTKIIKRWYQNAIMLEHNMPYLPKMYNFRFFSINLVNFFYLHLLICSTRISHDEKPNLCILSPKSLCKDEIINNIKYKDDGWLKRDITISQMLSFIYNFIPYKLIILIIKVN